MSGDDHALLLLHIRRMIEQRLHAVNQKIVALDEKGQPAVPAPALMRMFAALLDSLHSVNKALHELYWAM